MVCEDNVVCDDSVVCDDNAPSPTCNPELCSDDDASEDDIEAMPVTWPPGKLPVKLPVEAEVVSEFKVLRLRVLWDFISPSGWLLPHEVLQPSFETLRSNTDRLTSQTVFTR